MLVELTGHKDSAMAQDVWLGTRWNFATIMFKVTPSILAFGGSVMVRSLCAEQLGNLPIGVSPLPKNVG